MAADLGGFTDVLLLGYHQHLLRMLLFNIS